MFGRSTKNPGKKTNSSLLSSSKLRLANFVLIFSVFGIWYLVFTSAGPTPGFYGSIERDQLNRINSRRAAVGRSSLSHINCLHTVAEAWTKKMADAGGISHNPNLASQVSSNCGGYWSIIGENVGVGYESASLFNAFINSAAHRANIEDSRFTRAGLGAYYKSDGRLFVTQVFASCYDCSGGWNTTAIIPSDPTSSSGTYTTKSNDRISAGESINKGTIVFSAARRYKLVMQFDGNLVLYNSSTGQALWSSRTNGYGRNAVMQTDGNFVVYKTNGTACSSRTNGTAGRTAVVQDDGNFVIYTLSGSAVWSSRYNTWYC